MQVKRNFQGKVNDKEDTSRFVIGHQADKVLEFPYERVQSRVRIQNAQTSVCLLLE